MSKHRHLATALRQQLESGAYAVGDRLPTEAELAAEHGLAVSTVRRAVDSLVADGLVRRRQGSGMYVLARSQAEIRGVVFVGVVVPSAHYYFPQVIQGIEDVTSAHGARLVLCTSGYDVRREEAHIHRLLESQVDGVIVSPTLHLDRDRRSYLSRLNALPVPHVLLERAPERSAVGDASEYVATDHMAGGYASVRYLTGLAHRRIGFLGRAGTATADDVFAGYRSACHELRVEVSDRFVIRRHEWSSADGDWLLNAMSSHRAPTAFVCLGDREATLFLHELRRHGYSVPEQVALVGYDDEVAELAEVPLTAVSPPKYEVGRRAAEALLTRLADPQAPIQQVWLRPNVVVRASCGGSTTGRKMERRAAG